MGTQGQGGVGLYLVIANGWGSDGTAGTMAGIGSIIQWEHSLGHFQSMPWIDRIHTVIKIEESGDAEGQT